MINLTEDIQTLTTFKRNSSGLMKRLRKTGRPLVLTVKGKAKASSSLPVRRTTSARFIDTQHAPRAAGDWIRGMRLAVKTLSQHPERAHLAPESISLNEPVRELFYGKGNRATYRILFVVRNGEVYVLHVRHGSRLPLSSER